MKSSLALILAAALLLTGCASAGEATLEATTAPPSATSQPTYSPTLQPTITSTPEPRESPTPEPVYSYETQPVSFTSQDGLKLSGTFFHSEGDVAVLFVHMAGNDDDQKDWIPFANQVAQRGFSALTFDMRCHGATECRGGSEPGWVTTSWDMQAASKFLRNKGFKRIVCVGASMGGRACVTTAFDEELAGLVVISGTASDDPAKQDLNQMINPGMPKLFAVSENDPNLNRTADMKALFESVPEPKSFHLLPGKAHGTEFFKTQSGSALSSLIYEFLYGIRKSV
jgi:pimeloyl-ACP methyl ester carboxylesterase